MGLVSMITGGSGQLKIRTFTANDPTKQEKELPIDVSVQETHTTESEITENPVESGVKISDHIEIKPETLTIEALHTDTPLSITDIISGVGYQSAQNEGNAIATTRSGGLYKELLAIRDARRPIDIVTGLRLYKSMVLQKVTVTRTATIGKALKFTADFKQIILVDSQVVKLKKEALKGLSVKKVDEGKKAALPDDGKGSSVAYTGLQWLGVIHR